jgi:hypothetical protein
VLLQASGARLVGLIVLGSGVLGSRRCPQRREELQITDLWGAAPGHQNAS